MSRKVPKILYSDWRLEIFTKNGDARSKKFTMTPLFMSKSNQVDYAGSKAIYGGPEKCL